MDKRTCSVDECPRTDVVGYDGLCRKHYGRKRKTGRLDLLQRPKLTCSVQTCDEPVKTRRLCSAHYSRLLKRGSIQPDVPIRKLRELGDSKACSTCGADKPLDDFAPDNRRRDGRQARCRECVKAYQKRYRQTDREHYLELRRQEAQRLKAESRAYRLANKERIRQQQREWFAALSEDRLEAYREKHRLRSAEYRLKNPDLCNERIRRWGQANPDKASEYDSRRRARKYGNGDYEEFTRTEIGERDGWVCGICSKSINKILRFPDRQSPSLDHIIPLSFGGEHTRANSRITHLICNVQRGAARYESTGEPAA